MNVVTKGKQIVPLLLAVLFSFVPVTRVFADGTVESPGVVMDPIQIIIQAGGMGLAAYFVIWMTRDLSAVLKAMQISTEANTLATNQLASNVAELTRSQNK